jgi:hypothetical protein
MTDTVTNIVFTYYTPKGTVRGTYKFDFATDGSDVVRYTETTREGPVFDSHEKTMTRASAAIEINKYDFYNFEKQLWSHGKLLETIQPHRI